MAYPQVWITDEQPPRYMIVKGVAAIDWDCLVASFEGESKSHWIVEHSGHVCGVDGNVRARPVAAHQ